MATISDYLDRICILEAALMAISQFFFNGFSSSENVENCYDNVVKLRGTLYDIILLFLDDTLRQNIIYGI